MPSPTTLAGELIDTVTIVVERSQVDRRGAFWPVGFVQKSDPAPFQNTIGFGNPGIVLFLLEYYRAQPDRDIAELINRALDWIITCDKNDGHRHGFYSGSGGLWYLYHEVEKVFPSLNEGWRERALVNLRQRLSRNAQANLANGISGTILGALAGNLFDSNSAGSILSGLLDELLAGLKPSPEGVFWDISPTSIRSPAGLLQGSAGIDLSLALVRRGFGLSATSVLTGSLEYGNALFDAKCRNWLDYDAAEQYQRIDKTGKRVTTAPKIRRLVKSIAPVDSISWACGTTGILLARSALADAYEAESQVGARVRTDTGRAIARLNAITEEEFGKLDSSIVFGLAGLACGLQSCATLLSAAEWNALAPLYARTKALLLDRKLSDDKHDLSLLNGIVGLGYAKLRMVTEGFGTPSVCLPINWQTAVRQHPSIEFNLQSVIKRVLPAAAGLVDVREGLSKASFSLRTIEVSAADQCAAWPDSALARSIKHELGRYAALSDLRFHSLFWPELLKSNHYARYYSEGMDENILFGKFWIDECVTIIQIDFNPETHGTGSAVLVRHSKSTGITEFKVSPLQHALLTAFVGGAIGLKAIHQTVNCVDSPNVSQRQLADLCLRLVREFIQMGLLTSDGPNKFRMLFSRSRYWTVRMMLFPPAS